MTTGLPHTPEAPYLAAFDKVKAGDADWLMPARKAAMVRFTKAGLPHRRVEAWKYTDLRAKLASADEAAEESDFTSVAKAAGIKRPQASAFADLKSLRIVLVNGVVASEASDLKALPQGLTLLPFDALAAESPSWARDVMGQLTPERGDAIVDLNTGLMRGGIAIHVARNTVVDMPLELYFFNAGARSIFARNVIVVEEGAALTVIEHHEPAAEKGITADTSLHVDNVTSEISIGANAVFTHAKFQNEDISAFHLSSHLVRVAEGGVYDSLVLSRGAELMREQAFIDIAGRGAQALRRTATLTGGTQHHDHSVVINHNAQNGLSRFIAKNVLKEKGHAVVQGHTLVHPGAQASDGQQLIRAALLSEETEIDMKPQLEIYADDVKCAHGASAGALDEEALFYLRARGIAEADARALLVHAFLDDTLQEWGARAKLGDELREKARILFSSWIQDWLLKVPAGVQA